MNKVNKLTVSYHEATVGFLSQTPDNRLLAFEYAPSWLAEGFSISPLELPLRKGMFIAKPSPFNGNFGIFEDSLPDGYGRYLLHKTLLREGIDDSKLSYLERLSIVGNGGMGALTYAPENIVSHSHVVDDFDLLQEKALEVLKEQQDKDAGMLLYNSGNSGGCRPKALFSDKQGHWLVKFRHIYDPKDMGLQEFHYNEVAANCGIDVPDFKLVENKYFASRRFDLNEEGERIHTATAGGILCISLSQPILDYSNLLALTGFLTQDPKCVEEMFRRMVFNYLTENKDDHCKNFSFLIQKNRKGKYVWKLAPAYDLTHSSEGYNGEHATSVNSSGYPTLKDFIEVGNRNQMAEKTCRAIFDEVHANCGDLLLNEIKVK